MGKQRPFFEFKGLSGLLGDASSSDSRSNHHTYYSSAYPSHRRRRRHHHRRHHHKPSKHYSRRKHFAEDQRIRRKRAELRSRDDPAYLAHEMRRDEHRRESVRHSVLGGAEASHAPSQSAYNSKKEYFERVRHQYATASPNSHPPYPPDAHPVQSPPPPAFGAPEHDPIVQPQVNQSGLHYTGTPPPPPPPAGAPPRSGANNGARRPLSDPAQNSEDQHLAQQQSEEEGEELIPGQRGLLKKLYKSKLLEGFTGDKPRKKRKWFAAAGALAGAAALAFAGKRYMDRKKEEQKEQEEQAEAEAAEQYGEPGPYDAEGVYLGPNPLNLVPPPTKISVKVPQNEIFIVERSGQYHRQLHAGSHFLIPCVDTVSFRYSLKEASMPIPWLPCFTRDNVPIRVNAAVFIRVDNAVDASYNIDNAYHSFIILVQSTIKREFNKMTVEQAYTEHHQLDQIIKDIVNTAARAWGIRCTRFEIGEVELPEDLRVSLEQAAAADRQRREEVRAAETQREIMVNRAEAEMQMQMRMSQARQVEMVNQAIGEAHAITERSEAITNAMRDLAEAVSGPNGEKAMQMRLAEQYLQAYGQIATAGGNPPAPDPRRVAATMNDAIGLLNTLGQPSSNVHNPCVFPETNPFANAPQFQPQAGSSTGGMIQGVPDVPTTGIYHPSQGSQHHSSGIPPGTPAMSQTTMQGGQGSTTPAGKALKPYPQPRRTPAKQRPKSTPKFKPT